MLYFSRLIRRFNEYKRTHQNGGIVGSVDTPRERVAGATRSCFLLPGCQVFMWPCPLPTADWLKGGEGTCPKLIQWVLSPRIFGPETELKQTLFGVWGCDNIKLRCCLQSCFGSRELEDYRQLHCWEKRVTLRGVQRQDREAGGVWSCDSTEFLSASCILAPGFQ